MKTFDKTEKHDSNYLAAIFRIEHIRKHNNADRLQIVTVFANNIVTGLTAKEGDLYVYFPLECAISQEFLSYTNSFRDKTLNRDTTKAGFFENNNRVRAAKLRNERSEGYIVPVSELENFARDVLGQTIVIDEQYVGHDFDLFLEHQICKKYIPRGYRTPGEPGSKKARGNIKKYESKLVENQFKFHPDTAHLKREIKNINPDDYIAISEKLHGTSVVLSNVLCKKKLSLRDKIVKWFGVSVKDVGYDKLYSSRTVIKNVRLDQPTDVHFYDSDVWGIVADKYYPVLQKGYTFYGEIVGYTPSGAMIQKGYDYGCNPGELEFYVYRMTFTNEDGTVFELSPLQVKDYCDRYGVKTPDLHYFGKAKDMFPELSVEQHWHDNFLQKLMETYLEGKCYMSKSDVYREGIILRRDVPNRWDVYKLKSFNFIMGETAERDSGQVDMESQESSEEPEIE